MKYNKIYKIYLDVNLTVRYVLREEVERGWGVPQEDGSFGGIIGTLDREDADFSTLLSPTPERLLAMDYLRNYLTDAMTVVSLKPTALPQYLALVRPFSGMYSQGLKS